MTLKFKFKLTNDRGIIDSNIGPHVDPKLGWPIGSRSDPSCIKHPKSNPASFTYCTYVVHKPNDNQTHEFIAYLWLAFVGFRKPWNLHKKIPLYMMSQTR